MRVLPLAILALVLGLSAAGAVGPDEVLRDPALEARARSLSTTLRCLVCQNQSIDDSDAPLARDLRLLVRERLQEGDSDAAVRDFLVARFGDFVLLRPPVSDRTALLWFGPFLMLAAGVLGLVVVRGRPAAPPKPLDENDRARLEALLRRDAQAAAEHGPDAARNAPISSAGTGRENR